MKQKRSETLLKKVEINTDFLIGRFQNILALSSSTSSQEIQASEMLQIESNSMMMIRLVEELLSISRTLKENWILNQMPQFDQEQETVDLSKGISRKLDIVLGKIVQGAKYEEEISHEEEEEELAKEEQVKKEEEQNVKIEEVGKDEEGSVMVESSDIQKDAEEVLTNDGGDQQDVKEESIQTVESIQDNGGGIELDNDLQPLNLGTDGNLGEIDFEGFGSMDDGNNDIIMMD